MQGQWEEPIKVLAYRTSFGKTLEANDRKKKERKRHNGWLLHGLLPSRRSTTRVFELSSFLHYGTMRVLLSQAIEGLRVLQATKNNSPTKNSRRTGNTLCLFPLSLSSPRRQTSPESEAHIKTRCGGQKTVACKIAKVAYTHWMITTSRVQLQQQMYDAREQRRGIKPAWQTALVDRTKRAGEQEGKSKEGEEEMPFVLCPQVMPAVSTNDCCRKTRGERSMMRK